MSCAAEQTEASGVNAATVSPEHGGATVEEHGISPKAVEVFHIGPLPVTNSMLVTWIVALCLIVFAQIATKNIQQVPSGVQNFWEWLVESLFGFLEGLIGHALTRKTFW